MRKILMFFVATALIFGIATNAGAIPFQINPGASSVALSNLRNWESTSVSALLATLPGGKFNLGYGESRTFEFFELIVSGSGLGSGNVTATLGFSSPIIGSVTGSGSGWSLSLCGIFSMGALNWNTPPGIIELGNGEYFNVEFGNLSGLTLGNSTTVYATITAHATGSAAPVPEPATMLLFGCGLIGLAVVGRKKFQ